MCDWDLWQGEDEGSSPLIHSIAAPHGTHKSNKHRCHSQNKSCPGPLSSPPNKAHPPYSTRPCVASSWVSTAKDTTPCKDQCRRALIFRSGRSNTTHSSVPRSVGAMLPGRGRREARSCCATRTTAPSTRVCTSPGDRDMRESAPDKQAQTHTFQKFIVKRPHRKGTAEMHTCTVLASTMWDTHTSRSPLFRIHSSTPKEDAVTHAQMHMYIIQTSIVQDTHTHTHARTQ